jgi:colicin import membrane protein
MAKAELKPLPYVNRPERPSQGVGRIWKWVIISGVVHVVVIAYLLMGPILQGKNPAAPPVYTVDLLGGEKLGGGAGTSITPPPRKAKAEPEAPDVKTAPPVKETKKVKETVKPVIDEAKEAREAKAKAEMIERVKAKKEAEEKKKAEVEAKKKAEQEEAALVKARLEDLRKKRTEAALEDIRAKAAAKEKLEAEQRLAAERAAAEKAAAAQQAKSTLPGESPGAARSGPGGGTGGGIQKSREYIAYQNDMVRRIQDSFTWPGIRNDLTATIYFRVQDSGEITGIRLVKSSGDRSFDDSVVRALRKASPLSPLPDDGKTELREWEYDFNSARLRK